MTVALLALAVAPFLAKPAAAVWDIQIVDSNGDVGIWSSIAVDASGNPRISYVDLTAGQKVKYARWTGSAWILETVPDPGTGELTLAGGSGTSLALDSSGNPHIAYCLSKGPGCSAMSVLRYARWTGSSWTFETVDKYPAALTGVGRWPSLALDSTGKARIAHQRWYPDVFDLRYAEWTGRKWAKQTVDNNGGYFPSIALDSNGKPHIAYGQLNGEIRYTKKVGNSWTTQTVAQGAKPSLELDAGGNPHISYVVSVWNAPDEIRYARWTGSAWDSQVVDTSGAVCGAWNSLELDSSGNPHIAYPTVAGEGCSEADVVSLRYARWTGSAWEIQVVDSAAGTGKYPSLALDNANVPHVSYQDGTNRDLRYAKLVS